MKRMFLIIFILCISYNVYAIDCPPSSTCTNTFTSQTFTLRLDDFDFSLDPEKEDFHVKAEIRTRKNCDDVLEIIIDDVFARFPGIDNHEKLDEFNYLHYSFSSITEWIALDVITHLSAVGEDDDVPFCDDNESITRVHVYTASCGIWLRCSYKLPDPIEKVCDTGWEGGDPHYGIPNPGPPPTTDYWVDHWRWHSCGEVCCRKVFELCRDENLTYPGYYVKIKALTKEKYPGSDCSKQGDFEGPRPLPTDSTRTLDCEDGC